MSYIGNEPIVSATRTVTEVTATAGQTVFNANGGYTVGYLDVFLNGAQLQNTDFTATNGSSVTLTEAAQVNDVVRLVAWGTFSTSNLVSPNYTGTLTGGTDVVNIGSGQIYKSEAGNVGIGTSSPAQKLDVNGLIRGANSVQVNNNSQYRTYDLLENGTRRAYLSYDSTNNVCTLSSEEAGSFLSFATADTERMRVDSSGNLLIGTTGNTHNARGVMKIGSGTEWCYGPVVGYANNFYVLPPSGSGVYLVTNGTSWTANSDERLKDIIEPITDAANKVASLRAVIGKYKTDEEGVRRSFLIAQDVQAVLPEAVDATNPDKLGVQYTEVVPLLVAAIKEQQALIQSQADTITAMEARITALENK